MFAVGQGSLSVSHSLRNQQQPTPSLLKRYPSPPCGLAPNPPICRRSYKGTPVPIHHHVDTHEISAERPSLSPAFLHLRRHLSAGLHAVSEFFTITLVPARTTLQELEWSFRLFKEMRERGSVPNGVTCSALMDACLKANELDLAFAVLEHMLDVGIEPTEVRLRVLR